MYTVIDHSIHARDDRVNRCKKVVSTRVNGGVMENAGLENDGPTKINGVENARLENDGLKNRAGKCRTTHRRKST